MNKLDTFLPDMSISAALKVHPKAKEVFEKYGMLCNDCMASPLESIRLGAKMHGVAIEDVIEELNKLTELV